MSRSIGISLLNLLEVYPSRFHDGGLGSATAGHDLLEPSMGFSVEGPDNSFCQHSSRQCQRVTLSSRYLILFNSAVWLVIFPICCVCLANCVINKTYINKKHRNELKAPSTTKQSCWLELPVERPGALFGPVISSLPPSHSSGRRPSVVRDCFHVDLGMNWTELSCLL